MTRRVFVLSAILSLLVAPALAQPATATPQFEADDVHASAYTNFPLMRGGFLHDDHFIIRQATVVDLIANAYDVDGDNILGGPGWLDTDRFDIIALAARTTLPNNVKLMLRNLLAERFHLVIHNSTHPLPCYALRVDKAGLKIDAADPSEVPSSSGRYIPATPDEPGYSSMSFRNITIERFLYNLQQTVNSAYIGSKPLVDATDIKGGYDFELRWSATPKPDGLSVFDAIQKQLGLTLTRENCPLQVLIVDSVDEKPTPNAPGIDKVLPPPPPPVFEAATLKPALPDPDDKGYSVHIQGSEYRLSGANVHLLIFMAWDGFQIANPPKWLDKDRYDLVAKIPVSSVQRADAQSEGSIDFDDLHTMTRALLAERFHLQIHTEERPFEAYTLVADKPKLQKADPMLRSTCVQGAGPDGIDPRIANPALDRARYCHNVTMARFGELLRVMTSGDLQYPALDATGLKGGYDFSLSWTSEYRLQHPRPPSGEPAASPGSAAGEPNGTLSIFEAVQKELGLKLVKQKRLLPVLVIDHIDEEPTPN